MQLPHTPYLKKHNFTMKATIKIEGFEQFKEEVFSILGKIQQEVTELKGNHDADHNNSTYLSVSAVAKRLGLSRTKVRTLFHEGELTGKQLADNKKILIDKHSLERLERRTTLDMQSLI